MNAFFPTEISVRTEISVGEAVLMSTHNLCFERKFEKYQKFYLFLSEYFQFLVVKFSIYLNRHVFVMITLVSTIFVCLFVSFAACVLLSLWQLKVSIDV